MSNLLSMLVPELVLTGMACVLFLLGCSTKAAARMAAPWLALAALVAAFFIQYFQNADAPVVSGWGQSLRSDSISYYIRLIAPAIAVILLLLAWPSREDGTGNRAMDFGQESGEFFALFLLSVAGLLLLSIANDLIVLFLALEFVSIPTYIMVSMSRPLAVAQEAGLKYFFLGALSVALMLLGFSYLYGSTGEINFVRIAVRLRETVERTGTLPTWEMLAVLLLIVGFAYKMAAFPLHFYAGDVYEGAATPVTAFLAFVPKTAGFLALLRLLWMVGGAGFVVPAKLATFIWIMAVVTMSIGNVLALLQSNVKRVLAYSSIAHSGYMLAGVAVLTSRFESAGHTRDDAMMGVLFYLAAYGIMNSGAFGVLMLLPSRERHEDAAETFEDIAGQGREHAGLGLAMAVCCFSLIGIPLTVGFLGKLLLIRPALDAGLYWLAIFLIVNAAISAAYYLRIVATMFLRPATAGDRAVTSNVGRQVQFAAVLGVFLSVGATLLFGAVPQASQLLVTGATQGSLVRPVEMPEVPQAVLESQ